MPGLELDPLAASGDITQRLVARVAALEARTSGPQRVGSYDNTQVTVGDNPSLNPISRSITNALFVPNDGAIVSLYAQGSVWGSGLAAGAVPQMWALVMNVDIGIWGTIAAFATWNGVNSRPDNVFSTGNGVGADFTESTTPWNTGSPWFIPMRQGRFQFALATNVKSGTGSGSTVSDRRFISAWLA